ncbi:MalY/PatB family protein [Amycolatopsis sp. NPDC005003]
MEASAGRDHAFDDVTLRDLRLRWSEKWRRFPPDVLPLQLAEMDFPIAESVRSAILAHLHGGGDLGYAFAYTADSPLFPVFADWAADEFGWKVPADQLLLYPDVMAVVEAGIEVYTGRGDGIVVDTPGYPPFFEAVTAAGRRVVRNPVLRTPAGWRFDLAGLERAFRAGASAYVLCNPHNPTGLVLTGVELRRIVHLAKKYEVAVLADEVHAPVVYPGSHHVPIGSLPESRGVPLVTAMSASKGWNFAGLKCAIAVPGSVADFDGLTSLRPRERDGVGILGISASVAAFASGRRWLRQVVDYLDGNRALVSSLLSSLTGFESAYFVPEGTYLAWVDLRRTADHLGVDDLGEYFLHHARVAVSDGREYGQPGFVRLNFATSRSILRQAIARMARVVH